MPCVYLIHAGQAIDHIGVWLGESDHLLTGGAFLLYCFFHVVYCTLLGVTCQGLNLEEISSSPACPCSSWEAWDQGSHNEG